MGSIVVQAFLTLDGVVQGGGGPDEDRENGFMHGGWAMDYDAAHEDSQHSDLIEGWEHMISALLLGRKTYDIWAQAWGIWDEDAEGLIGEFTRIYNRVPKYVASRTLSELTWQNSQLLGPDLVASVAEIKTAHDGEIRIWGSTVLIKALAEHDLVDEYRLMIYPIVLGDGKRLFPDGSPRQNFQVAETRAMESGVTVLTLRRSP
jgi:dihydrofolate reductase